MIVFVKGTVMSHGTGYVDLDVHDIGYRLYVPEEVAISSHNGMEIRLYTYQHVREDAILLYGFAREVDRMVFERLLDVSGVGPKLAVQMLSFATAESIVAAIQGDDANFLCGVPGIGKKTAQRMILDLRDKFDGLPLTWDAIATPKPSKQAASDLADDVTTALIALGYRPKEAEQAVAAVFQQQDNLSTEGAVKAALTWLYAHQTEVNA